MGEMVKVTSQDIVPASQSTLSQRLVSFESAGEKPRIVQLMTYVRENEIMLYVMEGDSAQSLGQVSGQDQLKVAKYLQEKGITAHSIHQAALHYIRVPCSDEDKIYDALANIPLQDIGFSADAKMEPPQVNVGETALSSAKSNRTLG